MTRLKSRQNSTEELFMGIRQTEWKFIYVTALLVAAVALPVYASMMEPSEKAGPQALMVLRPTELKRRQPASLSPANVTANKKIMIEDAKKELSHLLANNLVSYDLACEKRKILDYKVEGHYLQLKGKDCSKGGKGPKLSITNKSNGFTAAVFMLNAKEYQTDLIQLQEGENQILIQYHTPAGNLEEQILHVQAGAI